MAPACLLAIGATLTTGAVKAIAHAGTEEQKNTYLPKMVSGEWTGTMNLTRTAGGLRPLGAAHESRSRSATGAIRSPARRSSSPMAITI
ncbi:MAG: acyl-CoA dehydrogenase family protein [Parvularculaceae bacterium]